MSNLVVKSNSLINSKGKYKYSKNELKIICSMISRVEKEETDFEIKQMTLSDIGFKSEDFNNHTYLGQLCIDLLSKPFLIPNTKKYVNWFSMLEIENGVLNYRFDPVLKPHLLNLRERFTSYYLSNVLLLTSSYSIHIYELLKQMEKVGYRKFVIEDLKEVLSIPKSYQFVHFKSLINNSIEDINENTDLIVNCSFEKVGRSFKYITFLIKQNKNINNDLNKFIKEIRKNYVNQQIVIGTFGRYKHRRILSVNPKGELYYLDDRTQITPRESKIIWNYLFNNKNELCGYYTKPLFDTTDRNWIKEGPKKPNKDEDSLY